MRSVRAQDAEIPVLGFGTFQLRGDVARERVGDALAVGYRHIDTAQMYGNEAEVGEAVRASGVPRDEIFLTTKVWPDRYADGDLQRSVDESLERLGLDHVDLLLLHWPSREVPLAETLGALAEVRQAGKTRHVGVSNFPSAWFRDAVALCDAPIVTNQVEYHPLLSQAVLYPVLRECEAALTAYCPLAQGKVTRSDVLKEIAERHGRSVAQITLRWLIQQDGVVAIPRSGKREHLESNLAVFDFELDQNEMARISALGSRDGRVVNPAGLAPEWD